MNIESHGKKHFNIHIGTVKLTFDHAIVSAREILEGGGAKPAEEFTLEALDRPGGKPVAEFGADDKVNLAEKDRDVFRAVPRGGGRS